jgi:sulfite exporter TauE/SafE
MLAHTLAGCGAFFAFGLAGGLHCAGMCGPLACLLGRAEQRPLARLGLYHAGRGVAYALVGACFAALGRPLRPILTWPVLAALGALPLLAFAFWPRSLAAGLPGRWLDSAAQGLGSLAGRVPEGLRPLGLGLLTPGLPCGLLYAAAGAALAAPSGALGAAWMLSFAAGTLPLLAASQGGFALAARRRSPAFVLGLRRATAAVAAGTILALSFLG